MDIKLWVDKNDPGAVLIPFSAAFENKSLEMDEAEFETYLKGHKVTRLVSASMLCYNDYYVHPVNVCDLYCCVALANERVQSYVASRRPSEIRIHCTVQSARKRRKIVGKKD